MADLYEALGLGKNATHEEARRAYRKAAKKAHPDAGGDAQQFAVVSLAHDVLTDEQRRAKYDATGSTEDMPQDKSMTYVMEAIDTMMNECTRRGLSCETIDVVSDARKTLKIRIEKMDEAYKSMMAQISAGKKLAKRFKAKKGKQNRISMLIEGRLGQMEIAAQKGVEDKPSILKAMEILSDHTFDYETQDGMSGSAMSMQFMMRQAFA